MSIGAVQARRQMLEAPVAAMAVGGPGERGGGGGGIGMNE